MQFLIVPGWQGSGPDHWQSHWERELPGAARIEVPDWDAPRRADWLEAIDRAVRRAPAPPIFITHSLGGIAVAHWAAVASVPAAGALLVAPADLDRADCPEALRDFTPVPRARLRFPSVLVASDSDPYASLESSIELAADWGSRIVIVRRAGHINTASGHGPWPDGRAFLRMLERTAAAGGRDQT